MTTMMPPMPPEGAPPAPPQAAPVDPAMMPPPQPQGAPGMPPAPPGDGIPMGMPDPNIARGGSKEPTIQLNQDMKHNWFDAPIPGESLTKELGSSKWEKPPKFVELEDAMNFIFDRLLEREQYTQFRAMIEGGVPIEAYAKVILFAGFGEGLWTMPMAHLMLEPTAKLLLAVAIQSGVKRSAIKTHLPKSAKKKKEEFAMFEMSMGKKEDYKVSELAKLTAKQPVDNPVSNMTGFLKRG